VAHSNRMLKKPAGVKELLRVKRRREKENVRLWSTLSAKPFTCNDSRLTNRWAWRSVNSGRAEIIQE
jgi:hypothetical protein